MDTESPEFQAALRDHAKTLGVDPDGESQLMALVQEALLAELPDGWEQGETEDGTLYYFNTNTEESIWEHPLDAHYRELIQAKKKELQTAKPTEPAPTAPAPVKTEALSVEVYSFDEESDDDNKPPFNAKDDKSSRISSLFESSSASSANSSASSLSTASKTDSFGKSTSSFASSTASTTSKTTTSNTSGGSGMGGFGRDRSWLLDGDDEDDAITSLTSLSRPNTATTASASRPSDTLSSSTAASTSASPYVSRLFGSQSISASPTAVTSTSNLSITTSSSSMTPLTDLSDGSPTASSSSSKLSPRRGSLASTIKGQIFQDLPSSTTTSTTTTTLSRDKEQQFTIKIQELEKKVTETTKQVDQLTTELEKTKQQLEQARSEAKEVHYHKMKANELKTKLADAEAEATAKLVPLQEQLQQLTKENDQLKKRQHQLQETEQSHTTNLSAQVTDLKGKISMNQAEKDAVQRQLEELQTKWQQLVQEHADCTKEKENWRLQRKQLEDQHEQDMNALKDRLQKAKDQADDAERRSERDRSEHRSEIQALRDQLDTAKQLEHAANDRKSESLSVLQETLDRQTKFLKEIEEKCKELQTQLTESEQNESDAKRKLAVKERECDDLLHKQNALHADLQAREREIKDIQTRFRAEQDAYHELQAKTSQWQRLDDELQRQKQRSDKEKQELVTQLRDKDDQIQTLQSQIKKQQDEAITTNAQLQLEIQQLTAQLKTLQIQTIAPLEKKYEQLQRENERLVEKMAVWEKDLRQAKQENHQLHQQLHQASSDSELWKRKEQQCRTQVEIAVHEKAQLEQQITSLNADCASLKHEKRLENEKWAFRIRELESQVAQRDYEIVRIEEKFTKAEAWRLKEAKRVEERDLEVLELKEELARIKTRNIDAENNLIIQELRREKEQLSQELKKRTHEVEEATVQKQVAAQKFSDDLNTMNKALEWQLPQLAAACVNRASEEWVRKCHAVVKALRDDFNMKSLQERTDLLNKIKQIQDQRDEIEHKYKTAMAESEFLRKEVHRVEDNNKVLLDQLHTIRVYLTQRAGSFPVAPFPSSSSNGSGAPAPAPFMPSHYSDFGAMNHLNAQLGMLHAQFQQLFDATERTKQPTADRFEIPTSPPSTKSKSKAPSSPVDATQSHLVDALVDQALEKTRQRETTDAALRHEQEQLITTLESIGSSKWMMPLSTPIAPTPSASTSWYQKDYWRTKYM